MADKKLKAIHQINHDGLVIPPGTVFTAPQVLADALRASGAAEDVEGDEAKGPLLELKITTPPTGKPPLTPQELKLAQDRQRLMDDQAKFEKDNDGLGFTKK